MNIESRLINAFLSGHPEEAAQALDKLDSTAVTEILRTASPEAGAQALQHVLPQSAANALSGMDSGSAAALVSELPFDAKLIFLHRLERARRDQLLDLLDEDQAGALRRLIDYPESSAGRVMDPSPLVIRSTDTVAEARKRLRTSNESLRYYVYVIDHQGRLVGVLTLRQLMRAKLRDSVSSLMETKPVSVRATASARDIVKHPRWRDFHSLPVVERNGKLIGVIRYETLGRLQSLMEKAEAEEGVLGTLLSLYELFWLGMTGTLDSMSARSTQTRSGG